jgi:hypothetical protein
VVVESQQTNENGDLFVQHAYVTREQVSELISANQQKWVQTPQRATDSRKLVNGEMLAPIPENFVIAGAAQFRADAPHKYLVPYHQRNTLSKDVPRVKRWRRGDSDERKLEATRIEQRMQAVMDDRYVFRDSVDILLMEGVCLSITLPDTASMSQVPSLYEKDGKTVKGRYARNKSGKARPGEKDDGYKEWRVSKKASAKLHAEDKRDVQARRIPIANELLGPTSFIPIFGPGLVLDQVIVERYWTRNDLIRKGIVWGGQGQLSPDGPATDHGNSLANTGGSNRIKVTELHAVEYQEPDETGEGGGCHPYVAYLVDGGKDQHGQDRGRVPLQKRTKTGDLVDALICLRCEYGLKQPHFVLEWGQHWAHPDYDKKAMPFPLPFAQSWMNIDAILTGAIVWAWWRGFPTLIEQPNANTPPDVDVHNSAPDDDDDAVVEIAPLALIRTKGTITELGTQGPSAVINWLVTWLAGANEDQGPPGAAFGGDASSGFQASLSRAYAEDAQEDIRTGSINLYKRTSSVMAEELCGIAERYGGSVPIQRITPVPLGRRSKDGTRMREILDITPDMFDGVFDLDADFPPQPNLAKGQQYAEWVQLGLILLEEFREEIIGDPNPEIFIARRLLQKIQDSPEYLQKIVAIAAQLQGSEQERQQLLALANGQAERGTDGVIRPMVPPNMLPPGPGAGAPAPTGAGGGPSIAGSALGGAVGGPIGAATQAAQSGGVIPSNIQLGPT